MYYNNNNNNNNNEEKIKLNKTDITVIDIEEFVKLSDFNKNFLLSIKDITTLKIMINMMEIIASEIMKGFIENKENHKDKRFILIIEDFIQIKEVMVYYKKGLKDIQYGIKYNDVDETAYRYFLEKYIMDLSKDLKNLFILVK